MATECTIGSVCVKEECKGTEYTCACKKCEIDDKIKSTKKVIKQLNDFSGIEDKVKIVADKFKEGIESGKSN